jgi:spermidine synthase
MGAGTTACYALPGQQWTFYEIDPAIVKIAHDPSLFTYIDNCAHGQVNYVLGDGRLRLKQAPANYYSLIALDAFSSDAIPIHLLTQEAVALYVSKLAERGIVAFHISNRHLELSRALGSVAQTSNLAALIMRDGEITPDQKGKDASIWVVMARSPNDLAELSSDNRWQKLDAIPGFRVWTDDFSNIFSVLKR